MQKTILLSIFTATLLVAQTIDLEPITVTSATKTEQSIKDVTSNLNVITSEEIEEKHYTSVTEALNSIPGISFTSNGGLGSTSSVYLRGFDSKRVLVLIDGIRYNDITGLNGAPFAHLMIGDIEQIEVVKGAQSGVWGADATAGVINIITKSAKDGLHGSANAEYGSFNTKKYGALASYKTDSYYLKLSSQKITTDGFSAKVPRGDDIEDYEKDGYVNSTSNIKLGFNINERNKIDISSTLIKADSSYDITDANSYATAQTQDSFTNINFNHKDSFNEVDIYAKQSLFNRDYPQGYTKKYKGEVYEYGAKSNIAYADKDFIILGVDYKTFEHENSIDAKYDNKALFITNNNEFHLFGKTIVTESLRVDLYDKFDDRTTGKLGIKNINGSVEGLVLSANIGTAYNVPTLYQLYAPAGFFGPVGNENLTPESTTSYDIGVEYRDIKLTYFNSTIENMIDYTTGYNNIEGNSKIQGFEAEYSGEIYNDLLLSANYTYMDTKDANGEKLQRRPQETLKATLDYYVREDLHLGVGGEYVGERVEYDYGTYDISAQTGGYALFNFVANYKIDKNFTTYAKVDNILNRYYQTVDGYAAAPISGYIGLRANF